MNTSYVENHKRMGRSCTFRTKKSVERATNAETL